MAHQLQNVSVTRNTEKWEAEIKAEIPTDVLAKYRERAIKEIQKTAQLDGFRVGKAPEDRIVAVYGEGQILHHAVEHAIEQELPELLAAEKLPIVEAPKVTTDDPAAAMHEGKPLVFTARAPLAPSVELADYKAISAQFPPAQESELQVTDAEHADALLHLRRERARIEKMEAGTEPQKAAEEAKGAEEKDLPALDDTFVQSLGYESTAAFSESLRKNMQTEKAMRASEKRRSEILEEMVKRSKISYPATLLEYELDDMEARLADDVSRIGQSLDAYLKETKKTREEMRASWKDAADKRAKVRLILAEISRKEAIEPDPAALEHELGHAREHYPSADPDALRSHIAHAMRNEMTLRFLESGKKEPLPVHEHQHDH